MNKIYKFQENKINVSGTFDRMFFYASQISKSIGYIDTSTSIRTQVWKENRLTVGEYIEYIKTSAKNTIPGDLDMLTGCFDNINKSTILLKPAGVFQLIYCSKLPNAITFEKLVPNRNSTYFTKKSITTKIRTNT